MTENAHSLAEWERRLEQIEAEALALRAEGLDDDAAIFEKAIGPALGMVQKFRRECQFDRAELRGTDRPGPL